MLSSTRIAASIPGPARPLRRRWAGPIALSALVLCVVACGSSDPAAKTTAARCSRVSVTSVPGAPLQVILRAPVARPAPLVVALHFATGTGRAMERATGLTGEARRAGFDVAYPSAPARNGFWRPEDLPRLQQTIAAVEKAACIDRTRVYALGWSNGGGMAALVACRMAGEVPAVALFAPAVAFAGRCSPSRAPSVLEVHGTADPIVPYADGRSFIGAWARRNGCARTPTTTRLAARATRLRWPGCRDGADVQHLRLRGGRHVELFKDLRAAGIDPNAAAWRFLSAHHA
jgi:polyhydroxybutyrate depolymerase